MPKLTCVRCRPYFKPKKNAIAVEEGMPRGDGVWGSYKLWQADLWECPGCGAQLVTGYGRNPIAEHYETDYAAQVARHAPLFRVDDC